MGCTMPCTLPVDWVVIHQYSILRDRCYLRKWSLEVLASGGAASSRVGSGYPCLVKSTEPIPKALGCCLGAHKRCSRVLNEVPEM